MKKQMEDTEKIVEAMETLVRFIPFSSSYSFQGKSLLLAINIAVNR